MKKNALIILTIALLLVGLTPIAALCDEQSEASFYLWRMINEARVHPLQTIQVQGIDEQQARQALGDDAWMLDEGLPPVAWNEALYQAAAGHNRDMVEQLYYSSTGLDGGTVADRVAAQGYEAVVAGELLGVMAFDAVIAPLEAARLLFENWLLDELSPVNTSPRHIFSRDFTEAGFSFNAAVLALGADLLHNVYVAVIDFARPREPRVFLLGNVFQDVNGDGQWNYGEGRPGVGMSFQAVGSGESGNMLSGLFGAYQVEISGFYCTVRVLDAQGQPVVQKMTNGMPLGREESVLFDFVLQ